MKPSDLFGIVVRTCGMYVLISGAWFLAYAAALSMGVLRVDPLEDDPDNYYFVSGIVWFAAGLLLLRAAPWFVEFSYPTVTADDTPDTMTSTEIKAAIDTFK